MRERLRTRRLELEAGADALFDEAWRDLRELAQPFRYELDALREPSGRWRDFLATSPLRALDLPVLLLEDLGVEPSAERDRAERGLLDATALAAAGVLALELATWAEASFSFELALLPPGLVASSAFRLADVLGEARAIGEIAVRHWNETGEALLAHRARRIGRSDAFDARDLARIGRRWAPLWTPLACATRFAGRGALWPELEPLFEEAAALFQIGRELANLTRDVSRGHCTFPIARLLAAFGATLPSEHAPHPGTTLLAAVVTRVLPEIAAQCEQRTHALLAACESQGLRWTRLALVPLLEPFVTITSLYDTTAAKAALPDTPFVMSSRPQLEQVLAAADGYLRDDPTYREAWEVNRWEFLNQPHLVCSVFPTGLVLENRGLAGDDCDDEVAALFARYALNRFHYYDEPSGLPPDIDLLGLMLRLGARSRDRERWRDLLATPLGWLRRNVEEDGGLPVFMTRDLCLDEWPPYARVSACRCAAVQAGLLLGLVEMRPDGGDGWDEIVERGARAMFSVIARGGGGAFWFYDAPLGVGMVLALVAALRAQGYAIANDAVTAEAEAQCVGLLRAQRDRARMSSLDAALLFLATEHGPARALRDPVWLEHLVRTQRHDGTWDASPLYTIPTRGNLTNWYSSRIVTASFAYRALRDSQR